jgi:hypothetical protein
MPVPPAQKRSWEDLLHSISPSNKIILSSEIQQNATLQQSIGQRAIGVRYYPNSERGNYVPSIIPKRYDAFLSGIIRAGTTVLPLKQQGE